MRVTRLTPRRPDKGMGKGGDTQRPQTRALPQCLREIFTPRETRNWCRTLYPREERDGLSSTGSSRARTPNKKVQRQIHRHTRNYIACRDGASRMYALMDGMGCDRQSRRACGLRSPVGGVRSPKDPCWCWCWCWHDDITLAGTSLSGR